MLDLQYIKVNQKKVKDALLNKNRKADVDRIIFLDEKRREQIKEIQTLREERNSLSKINPPSQENINRGKEIKESLKKIEEENTDTEKELSELMLYIVNVPLDEVPVGKDESGNLELKKWGEPRKFDFTPKDHITLGTDLDILDLERGNKVSGFRGYFLKNEGAILHMALLFYVFQKLTKKGYTPIIAPSIIKGFTLFGSGHFPWGSEQDVYKLNDDDAYLSGTAEIPITALHAGETLNEKDLPKKFVGFSPCFRKEAGTYGRDTRGIYRLHEFWKIEQVILGTNNIDKARDLHEELQKNSEEILQELNLPYRQLLMCTGDMGEPQMKKYDIETYMPSRNGYGETMSNSIMGDFQARRLKMKYKTKEGKTEYVYTFNNTAVASPRILIAILENYQQEDGSVRIPEVLQSLTGFKLIANKK
jgi:seryl-tRNA synthetase